MKIYIDCGAYQGEILLKNINKFDKFYVFEANPDMIDQLNDCKKKFLEKDIEIRNAAVWTQDEELKFYLSRGYQTGSTLMDCKTTGNVDYKKPIKIQAFDFSSWLKTNINPEDFVYLKMDIEGAEYDVLNKMIKDKTIFLINEFLIEFHSHKLRDPKFTKEHNRILNFIHKNNIKAFHHFKSGQKPV